MSYEFMRFKEHIGHRIELAYYGDRNNPANIAIECIDCNTVLVDADNDTPSDSEKPCYCGETKEHKCTMKCIPS